MKTQFGGTDRTTSIFHSEEFHSLYSSPIIIIRITSIIRINWSKKAGYGKMRNNFSVEQMETKN